jgi:ribosomal protein S18 acetylase RimI-like enzyme
MLEMIGVRREAQGRGIGEQLLAPMLDHIDRLGCPSYLESSNPRNVSLYERHGFVVLAEVEMLEDGPVVRPMLRPPR